MLRPGFVAAATRPAAAALELDTVNRHTSKPAAAAQWNISYTLWSGGNRRLFAAAAIESTSVTISGAVLDPAGANAAMSEVIAAHHSNNNQIKVWELHEAGLLAGGAYTVRVNLSGSVDGFVAIWALRNASQAAAVIPTFVTGSSVSTLSSASFTPPAADSMVFDLLMTGTQNVAWSPQNGQTSLYYNAGNSAGSDFGFAYLANVAAQARTHTWQGNSVGRVMLANLAVGPA